MKRQLTVFHINEYSFSKYFHFSRVWLMFSPILKDRSPLFLHRSYDPGLLPTPKIKPLRRVCWIENPVTTLDYVLKKARRERCFTMLHESQNVAYTYSTHKRLLVKLYGEKIGGMSKYTEEASKVGIENTYSPQTTEIYSMLSGYLIQALQDANCDNESGSKRSSTTEKKRMGEGRHPMQARMATTSTLRSGRATGGAMAR